MALEEVIVDAAFHAGELNTKSEEVKGLTYVFCQPFIDRPPALVSKSLDNFIKVNSRLLFILAKVLEKPEHKTASYVFICTAKTTESKNGTINGSEKCVLYAIYIQSNPSMETIFKALQFFFSFFFCLEESCDNDCNAQSHNVLLCNEMSCKCSLHSYPQLTEYTGRQADRPDSTHTHRTKSMCPCVRIIILFATENMCKEK